MEPIYLFHYILQICLHLIIQFLNGCFLLTFLLLTVFFLQRSPSLIPAQCLLCCPVMFSSVCRDFGVLKTSSIIFGSLYWLQESHLYPWRSESSDVQKTALLFVQQLHQAEVSAAGGSLAGFQHCNICRIHCLTAVRLEEMISSPPCFLPLVLACTHVCALPVETQFSCYVCKTPVLSLLRLFISSCAVSCSK